MHKSPNYLGLSLSGGGYRAAAFHLSTMRKLNELNLMEKVNVLSTISGGSITGAYYCLDNSTFKDFESGMKEIISTKSFIRYILTSFIFIRLMVLILAFLAVAVYMLFTPYPYLSVIILATFGAFVHHQNGKIINVNKTSKALSTLSENTVGFVTGQQDICFGCKSSIYLAYIN